VFEGGDSDTQKVFVMVPQDPVLKAKLVKGYGGLFLFEVTAQVRDAQIAKGTLTLAEERGQTPFHAIGP